MSSKPGVGGKPHATIFKRQRRLKNSIVITVKVNAQKSGIPMPLFYNASQGA